jgi:hypothetical protein
VCDCQLLKDLSAEVSVLRSCPFEITERRVLYKPQYLIGVFRGKNSGNLGNAIKALIKIQEGDIKLK